MEVDGTLFGYHDFMAGSIPQNAPEPDEDLRGSAVAVHLFVVG